MVGGSTACISSPPCPIVLLKWCHTTSLPWRTIIILFGLVLYRKMIRSTIKIGQILIHVEFRFDSDFFNSNLTAVGLPSDSTPFTDIMVFNWHLIIKVRQDKINIAFLQCNLIQSMSDSDSTLILVGHNDYGFHLDCPWIASWPNRINIPVQQNWHY